MEIATALYFGLVSGSVSLYSDLHNLVYLSSKPDCIVLLLSSRFVARSSINLIVSSAGITFRQDMPATGIVSVVKKLAALTPQSVGTRDDDAYQDEDRTTVVMARKYADTPNQWPQSDIQRDHKVRDTFDF